MPEMLKEEVTFKADEKTRTIIGTRLTIEEFQPDEFDRQIDARKQVKINFQEGLEGATKELEKLEVHQKIVNKWKEENKRKKKDWVDKIKAKAGSQPTP